MLLFMLLLPLSGMLYSQVSVGVSVGYDRNNLSTGSSYRSFVRNKAMSGFSVGLPVRYDVNDWFGVQSELTYIQKNNKTERNYAYSAISEEMTNSYLQVPLMGHFSFGSDKIRGFLNLGGYGAYWLSGNREGINLNVFGEGQEQLYPYDESYKFDSRKDRRMEFGLVGGIGVQYNLNQNISFFAESRYYYSLTDMQKDYMYKRPTKYNNTLAVNVGCMFSLSNILSNK